MAGLVYNRVENLRPQRNAFDLSYEKKLTCDMGQLIPIMCDEVIPGDTWNIGAEMVIRMQPTVAPVLHEINAFIHYFFVPYRILWSSWESFITGGELGADASTLPTWNCTDHEVGNLYDYLGFPTEVTLDAADRPVDFPRRAYNNIYNHYYRDETQVTEVDEDVSEHILLRAWEKDYFTSALPWQQRGTAPALPLSGTTNATWVAGDSFNATDPSEMAGFSNAAGNQKLYAGNANAEANAHTMFEANTVDFSGAGTFDVADLRLAFQIQKWMERNARTGGRYEEFLMAHFGVMAQDQRLQRPEYIGGIKTPVIVSEVPSTHPTDADDANLPPQGTLAGKGVAADRGFVGTYTAHEYGLIMGILSVMPRTAYCQGVPKQWMKSTRYDFFHPEFAMLSEQPILKMELFATGVKADDETVWGYQGRYDELRTKQDMIVGDMRDTFDYWHCARQFAACPSLNQTFIEMDGTAAANKRIFAATSTDGLIVNVRNVLKAIRPIPEIATPGLVD